MRKRSSSFLIKFKGYLENYTLLLRKVLILGPGLGKVDCQNRSCVCFSTPSRDQAVLARGKNAVHLTATRRKTGRGHRVNKGSNSLLSSLTCHRPTVLFFSSCALAVICPGHHFPAKFVIHCNVPSGSSEPLEKCVRNCLALADEKNIRVLAVPPLATHR